MGHSPTFPPSGGGRVLAAMRRFQGPNVVVLTRANRPPIPGYRAGVDYDETEEPPTVEVVEGSKVEQRGMSDKSSHNLAKLLSTLDWGYHGKCVHVTLTYRNEWPGKDGTDKERKQAISDEKKHLVALLGRNLEAGIWRLEYQKRLAPHWHVLAWLGGRDEEDFERWVRRWWAKFSRNDHERGVKITSGDQARGIWYLAMHAAKREQSPSFAVGRWWGYINKAKLLAAQDLHETGLVQAREEIWWKRLYRRHTGAKSREGKGLSWFLPRSAQTVAFGWIQSRVEDEIRERSRPRNPY